jgi:hypothetical protein
MLSTPFEFQIVFTPKPMHRTESTTLVLSLQKFPRTAVNRVSIALKMAASTLRRSNTYLGAQFRRFRTKLGSPIAIKAMAAKLARLVYRMLRYGMKYLDQGAKFYETQHRNLQIKQLKWKAAKLGFQVVQAPAA